MERNFYVLAYDIANDRRRSKIARLCEAVAERVQHSVFEGYFTPPELERLLMKAGRIFNEKEDSLRIYQLCASCRAKAATRGQRELTPPPGVVIV